MEVREATNSKDFKHYTTKELREEFHIANLFIQDNIRMVYSHTDRIITAGFMPVAHTLKLEAGKELAGPAVFLASDASNAVNGHILYVDGGILAYVGKQPQ